MSTTDNKKKLEQELITEFLNKFYETMGYFPTVITNSKMHNEGLKILPLNQLEKYFEKYLYGMSGQLQSLNSSSRIRPLVELRFTFFFIARQMRYTLTEIGQYLGGKDHTTVIHGIKTFKNLYEVDEKFKHRYDTIINNIKKNNEPSALEHLDQMEIES